MGCFSYLCKECGEGVNSDSFSGELCRIYFLEGGEVKQEMRGQYDSYGRVFLPGSNDESAQWDYNGHNWGYFVEAHFNKDRTTGFAIVHESCFNDTLPKTISKNDPDQGWNAYVAPSGEKVKGFL